MYLKLREDRIQPFAGSGVGIPMPDPYVLDFFFLAMENALDPFAKG